MLIGASAAVLRRFCFFLSCYVLGYSLHSLILVAICLSMRHKNGHAFCFSSLIFYSCIYNNGYAFCFFRRYFSIYTCIVTVILFVYLSFTQHGEFRDTSPPTMLIPDNFDAFMRASVENHLCKGYVIHLRYPPL